MHTVNGRKDGVRVYSFATAASVGYIKNVREYDLEVI
jgi:hypothetical protein